MNPEYAFWKTLPARLCLSNGWRPYDGTPQGVRCDLDKLGFASVRIPVRRAAGHLAYFTLLQQSPRSVMGPLRLTTGGRFSSQRPSEF